MEGVVVDTASMQWEQGLDVISKMVPEFRENLGPADLLDETYAKYRQKTLFVNPDTTQRADLIELDPGYADLTNAYHDSVEECFMLAGHCSLTGEGDLFGGYYFWRPPGWVHAAQTPEGFRAILMLEGESPSDGSGPASRRIRPEEEAGTNALHEDLDRAIGPRGWVKHLNTRLVVWQRGPVFTRTEGPLDGEDLEHVSFKVLSRNPVTGAQSLLVRLDPGYRRVRSGRHIATRFFFVVSGSVALHGTEVGEGGFRYLPGGSVEEPIWSETGALLFMKVDGQLDFHPAES